MNKLRISKTTARWIYWGMHVYILFTISITTLLLSFHIHPTYSAPLLCAYTLIMFMAMVIQPLIQVVRNRKGLSYGNQP